MTSVDKYIRDVGRKPLTARQSVGNRDAYMYFVDSAGQVLSEDVAMQVAKSIYKSQAKGKTLEEKLVEAAETVVNGDGMYAENDEGLLDSHSTDSEQESESSYTGSGTSKSESEDDDSVEVTYWTDQETNIMYAVLYDHSREQAYVENDTGIRVYLDDEGNVDTMTTEEFASGEASIHTMPNEYFQTVGHSSFVTVTERRSELRGCRRSGSRRSKHFGIMFVISDLVLEEVEVDKATVVFSMPNKALVTESQRDQWKVEELMKLEGKSPDAIPVAKETWIKQFSIKDFKVFEEDGCLRMIDAEGKTHPLIESYGHLARLAAMYQDGTDEIAEKVMACFVERINVSAEFCVQTNGVYDRRCLMYMIGYGRTLEGIEKIVESDKVSDIELYTIVRVALERGFDTNTYEILEREEGKGVDSKHLAAHICIELHNADDYYLYYEQELLEQDKSNYRQAITILYRTNSSVDIEGHFICVCNPPTSSPTDSSEKDEGFETGKVLSIINEVISSDITTCENPTLMATNLESSKVLTGEDQTGSSPLAAAEPATTPVKRSTRRKNKKKKQKIKQNHKNEIKENNKMKYPSANAV